MTTQEQIAKLEAQRDAIQIKLDEQQSYRGTEEDGFSVQYTDPMKLYDRIDKLNAKITTLKMGLK